jgi:acylphosphatase
MLEATSKLYPRIVERLHAVVRGDVQGVGFRYFLVDSARPLGLRGWVRNRPDGAVEVLAEGDRPKLERLLQAAREGPRHARVEEVEVEWGPPSGGLGPFDLNY